MATDRSLFIESANAERRLEKLLQTQLSKVRLQPSTIPSSPISLDYVEALTDALSSLSDVCQSVLADVHQRSETVSVSEVVQGIENVLEWKELLNKVNIEAASSDPEFLFRAHQHVGTGTPMTFRPTRLVYFNVKFKRTFPLEDFAGLLEYHLGKTQAEQESGERSQTCFLSMSPMLDWTVHTTWQRSKIPPADQTPGLAVFDVKKLRQTPGVTLFRVSDILNYLEVQGRGHLVPSELQQWAKNCDEYLLLGKVDKSSFLRWIPWPDLYVSRILSEDFLWSYTLGIYRQQSYRSYDSILVQEAEDVCQIIFEFGKVLAGPNVGIIRPLVELVLKAGLRFWRLKSNAKEEIIQARVHELVNEAMLGDFSMLKISGD